MSEIAWRFAPQLVEDALRCHLSDPDEPDEDSDLPAAMRHAVFGGG